MEMTLAVVMASNHLPLLAGQSQTDLLHSAWSSVVVPTVVSAASVASAVESGQPVHWHKNTTLL